jgi:hypothetical protein
MEENFLGRAARGDKVTKPDDDQRGPFGSPRLVVGFRKVVFTLLIEIRGIASHLCNMPHTPAATRGPRNGGGGR